MATKKDLVEAYSFSRRRLVTAFVSGAPGGREVEPSRPGRTIVGGVALAVLLAAGAAVAGALAPRTPADWNQPGLIISKETGAAYVILESDPDELRPVINTTSAKLILGAGSEPTLISQDTIDDQRIGEDIGILGAPASVPTSSLLINTGWTACTGDGDGVRVTVADDPAVTTTPDAGVVVQSDGAYFVVAQTDDGTYAYELPEQTGAGGPETDNLLEAIGLPAVRVGAAEVPRQWLSLFPSGAAIDLDSLRLDRFGERPEEELPADAGDALVGDVLQPENGDLYLVTNDGPVLLPPFAAALYPHLVRSDGSVAKPIPVSTSPAADRASPEFLVDTDWPTAVLTQLGTDPCAQLTAEDGRAPVAQLVSPADPAAQDRVAAGEKDQAVDPGRGAYVLSGDWSGRSTDAQPFLIDAKGRANPLVGAGAAEQLGYADVAVPVVPDTWVELFRCGVNLSQAAALLPPDQETGSGCGDE
ncbi:type VII secretion protein EccB [Nocardioides pyridinolyticus]